MLIDFQQHYTPPELLKGEPGKATADLDRDGNPHYLLNPLLADLGAHIRMMDAAGVDAGVLTCGAGFDQPDIAVCRLINDRLPPPWVPRKLRAIYAGKDMNYDSYF